MQDYIPAIASLTLTGLAFIAYRHPSVAKTIIVNALLASAFMAFSLLIYYYAQRNAYQNSVEATNLEFQSKPGVTWNSPFKGNASDSIFRDRERVDYYINNEIIKTNTVALRDSIRLYIISKAKKLDSLRDDYIIGAIILLATLGVFFLLSNLFEKIRKPDSKKQDYGPDEAS